MDDTNNIIVTKDISTIQPYVDNYFKLLENFYHLNKLKINPEKSQIMIVCKPTYREGVKNIVINTDIKVINQVQKLKALGMYFTSGLSSCVNVNNIVSKINFHLSLLKNSLDLLKGEQN